MQAVAPKQKVKPQSTVKHEPDGARLSMRTVTGLEIASVISTVMIITWALLPLQPRQRWLVAIPALLAIGMMINSHRMRGESPRELGFTLQHFGRGLRLVMAPTLIASAAFVLIGYLTNSFHLTTHFLSNLLIMPVWALIQQYVLQGFIYRRLREIFVTENDDRQVRLTIITTAAIFAFVHAPNLTLMVLTFLGALIWSWVYERAPNLYAIALSHAAISLMLMTMLPPWILQSMSVGYKHFLYRKF